MRSDNKLRVAGCELRGGGGGLGLVALLFIAGCQAVRVEQPLSQAAGWDAAGAEAQFVHELRQRPLVSNHEAAHALLLWLQAPDAGGYEQRIAELRRRGMLPRDFAGRPDDAMDKGTLAVALARALELKGGLTMALTGITPRYATRTLEHHGVFLPSSPNQLLTGAEFVAILGKAEDHRKGSGFGVQGSGRSKLPVANSELPVALASESSNLQTSSPLFLFQSTLPAMRKADRVAITHVQGVVDVKIAPSPRWVRAEAGMELPLESALRTGMSGVAHLEGLGTSWVVDRNSEVQFVGVDGVRIVGRSSLKASPVTAIPEKAGQELSGQFQGPRSALGVRGTEVIFEDEPPFPAFAACVEGRAYYMTARGRFTPFGAGRAGDAHRISRAQNNAAEWEMVETTVDPSFRLAREPQEQRLLDLAISRGAVVSFDRGRGLSVLRGGEGLPPDSELVPALPGQLNFVLGWDGPANLDLSVFNLGTDELLHPTAGLTRTAGGGRVAFDHQGGSKGGFEVASWKTAPPDYSFTFYASNLSGKPVTANWQVYRDGQLVRFPDPQGGPFSCTTRYQATLGPGQADFVEVSTDIPCIDGFSVSRLSKTPVPAPRAAKVPPRGRKR